MPECGANASEESAEDEQGAGSVEAQSKAEVAVGEVFDERGAGMCEEELRRYDPYNAGGAVGSKAHDGVISVESTVGEYPAVCVKIYEEHREGEGPPDVFVLTVFVLL